MLCIISIIETVYNGDIMYGCGISISQENVIILLLFVQTNEHVNFCFAPPILYLSHALQEATTWDFALTSIQYL